MNAIQLIALTLGGAWASGINLYAAIFVLGSMGAGGYIALPVGLEFLQQPMVLYVAAGLYVVEFFIDKIPGLDSAWDVVHSFIRVPAGAVLAAAAVGEMAPSLQLVAGLIGGSVAATSHAAKTGTRLLVNTSPEPVSNWSASLMEDVMVLAGLWTALQYPGFFLAFLLLFLIACSYFLPKIWRVAAKGFRYMRSKLPLRKEVC